MFHHFNECINVDFLEQTVRESALEKVTVFHYFNKWIYVNCLEQTVRESALEKVTVCSIILTNGFMLTV